MSSGSSDDAPRLVLVVARSGGFAGLTRRWRVEVRDEADAARWRPLVDACPWEASAPSAVPDSSGPASPGPGASAPGASAPGTSARDGFVYRISLADTTAPGARPGAPQERTATVPESSLDGPWRALVERVQDEGQAVPAGRRGSAVER
ncbi:protealysin inhibitor emfourin [Herbiconiux sp. SYSU D00978]|uniref:protealysin inhibitor emfourin n=1 Tax=Herbiconiux sp. SYSU D00978 TaxID=2812562 RepID=UPI001A975FA4|nr:protealysin inhibitor emfourin [Herbiconiux sp. SYSU D00978]